jgi:moderate conductance mechanosensitive channel
MPQLLRYLNSLDNRYIVPLVHIIVIIVFAYLILRLVDSGLRRLRSVIHAEDLLGVPRASQRTETLSHIIRSIAKWILIVFVLFEIGAELGFIDRNGLDKIWASAGIATLALAFGAQSLVKDVISGFFILFEDQFGVGDVVKIGDFSGVVEKMTLRATVLRNLEGQVHVVPNGNIQHVTVMTKEWARAVLDVTLRIDEDLEKIFAALQRVATRLAADFPDRVLETPTTLGVEKLDDTGMTIRSIVKTPPYKQADVLREWRRRVKEEFDRAGIQFTQKAPTVSS